MLKIVQRVESVASDDMSDENVQGFGIASFSSNECGVFQSSESDVRPGADRDHGHEFAIDGFGGQLAVGALDYCRSEHSYPQATRPTHCSEATGDPAIFPAP
jgi:hypothetical protein